MKIDLDNIWVRINENTNSPTYFFSKKSILDSTGIIITNVDNVEAGDKKLGDEIVPSYKHSKKLSLPEIIKYRLLGILKI